MNSDERIKPESAAGARSVSFRTLGLIGGSVVSGAAGAVILMRIADGETMAFSTVGLLGFFLMTLFAGAAVTLAGVSIRLARSAERTIAEHSKQIGEANARIAAQTARLDESLRQSREEISKMIETQMDVLAKKFRSDILTLPKTAVEKPSPAVPPAAVEMPSPVAEAPAPQLAEITPDAADKKYSEFKDIVLLGVANYPGVEARKVGEGHYKTQGDELVDGAFTIQRESVAVCAFATDKSSETRFLGKQGDSFSCFLQSLANELKSGHFTRVFLVFDSSLGSESPYARALNEFSGRVKGDVFAKFELFEGVPTRVIPELTERVSLLMEQAGQESSGRVAG